MKAIEFYNSLSSIQAEIRDTMCQKFGYNQKTFYNHLNADSFCEAEREVFESVSQEILERISNQKIA